MKPRALRMHRNHKLIGHVHKDWGFRACPSCGESKNFTLELSSTRAAETMSFNEVREYFIGIRHEQVFFSYHRCQSCSLLFCPNYFSEGQLDSLYSEMPDNLLGAEKSVATRTQHGYFSWIMRNTGNKVEKYLELGPDIGLITEAIARELNPSSLVLVEPNISMHGRLQKLRTSKNSIHLARNLNQVSLDEIDLTIGIHVFDHLLDPGEHLKTIYQNTKFGGYIGIVVHDEASLLRKILGKKWPPFCLQHPQLFSSKTLTGILVKNGFKKIKISKSVNHFSVRHLGSLVINVLGMPRFLSKVFPEIEIPILLGNQISVFKKNMEIS